MSTYSLYDSSGRVTIVANVQQAGQLPALVSLNGAAGYVQGQVNGTTHYIQDGHVTLRPPSTATLTGNVLTGLTAPCVIRINARKYPCNEPRVELEFDQPGRYRVVVQAWPQLEKEFEIENSAP